MSADATISTIGVVTMIAGGGLYSWGQGWIPNAPPYPSSDLMYTLYLPVGLVAGGLIAVMYAIGKA